MFTDIDTETCSFQINHICVRVTI